MTRLALLATVLLTACSGDSDSDTDLGTDVDSDTEASYSNVEGTVSGLINGSLTLELNGESLVVDANGAFAFEGPFEDGTAFDLTATEPTGQACVVSGAPETVAGDVALTVDCTCNWTPGRDPELQLYADFAATGLEAESRAILTRGYDGYVIAATCGGVVHDLADSIDDLPIPEGQDWTDAEWTWVEPVQAVGTTVYGMAWLNIVGGNTQVLYRASAPDFEMEVLFYSEPTSVDGAPSRLRGFHVSDDGTIAARGRVWSGESAIETTWVWNGTAWTQGVAIGDTVDGEMVCSFGDTYAVNGGRGVAQVRARNECFARGRGGGESTMSDLIVFDSAGTVEGLFGDGDLVDGRAVQYVGPVQVDGSLGVFAPIGLCADDAACIDPGFASSYEQIVRVDAATAAVTTEAAAGDVFGDRQVQLFEGPWAVSPGGVVAAVAQTTEASCTDDCSAIGTLIRTSDSAAGPQQSQTYGGATLTAPVIDEYMAVDDTGAVVFENYAYQAVRGITQPTLFCWADATTPLFGPAAGTEADDQMAWFRGMWFAGDGQWAVAGLPNLRGLSLADVERGTCTASR